MHFLIILWITLRDGPGQEIWTCPLYPSSLQRQFLWFPADRNLQDFAPPFSLVVNFHLWNMLIHFHYLAKCMAHVSPTGWYISFVLLQLWFLWCRPFFLSNVGVHSPSHMWHSSYAQCKVIREMCNHNSLRIILISVTQSEQFVWKMKMKWKNVHAYFWLQCGSTSSCHECELHYVFCSLLVHFQCMHLPSGQFHSHCAFQRIKLQYL